MKIRWRKSRPRRHGLKLPGGYRCKCCYDELRGKAVERRMRDAEVATQLAEHLAFRVSCGLPHAEAAKIAFGGQCVINNTPLFEAMDKMSAEISATATVSGTNNDYSPSGWQDATSVILTGQGTITGFAESELQNWAEQLTQEMMSK